MPDGNEGCLCLPSSRRQSVVSHLVMGENEKSCKLYISSVAFPSFTCFSLSRALKHCRSHLPAATIAKMFLFALFLSFFGCLSTAYAAFGITTATSSYTVDAGSAESLFVTVSRTNCDITSIIYRASELQYQSQKSHLVSGLGSATVSATIVNGILLPPSSFSIAYVVSRF